jgi:hypothetical protein
MVKGESSLVNRRPLEGFSRHAREVAAALKDVNRNET